MDIALQVCWAWLRARIELARREPGFSSVEWLFIALGVLTIAGLAVAGVTAYVKSSTARLGGN
jgi:hypothetical protein